MALEQIVETIHKLDQGTEDVEGLVELAVEAEDEDTFIEAQTELEGLIEQLEVLEFRRMFSGPNDENDCYIDIQSGSGGTEAQDWANMLLRMYLRWGEAHGFKTELIEVSEGEVAGIKSATLRVQGEYAFGWLRTETGVHRLVRKSPFDSGNRRHTSFSSAFVYPEIDDNYKQVLTPQTAYQMTSILEGVVKRGTGKKLKKLKLNLAGKTGTTNENTDAWFIGYTSNFVIGVYVGMDEPSPLGKYETGSKTALPIFENFVKKTVKKSNARPFKVSEGITMMVVDTSTGQKAKLSSKNTLVEAYKSKNVVDGKVLYSNNNRLDSNNILKFY